ncbi:inosine/uridine-preferring nucleoside hydrolase [Stagonosporopsis vannaccii]|nr:inosine/uridine-preferring nucleoside hydrolase [Stagonosporopsis vannaccii]
MIVQLFAWFVACAIAVPIKHYKGGHRPKTIIIDTDLLDFVDDPLAIGLANIFQKRHEAVIVGIASSVFSRYVPPAIDAINTYYGHGDIPIAIQKPVDNTTRNPTFPQENEYLTGLTFNFPQDIEDGSNTTYPVILYRKLLASSPDHSVTVANIGFHDNLYNLLRSPPDDISPLSGRDLVRRKVVEHVVQGNPNGTSFNFEGNDPKFAQFVLTHWPGLVTYVPDAIGSTVLFGSRLTTELNTTKNPVAYAAAKSIGVGKVHESWDSTAIYYAVRGLESVYRFERDRGEIRFHENGTAIWDYGSRSRLQRSIELRVSNTTFAAKLERLLLSEP